MACVEIESLVVIYIYIHDFPGGSDGKASAYNAGDPGSIPGSGRSPGWKIPWMEEPGRLQSTVSQRVQTRLSDYHYTHTHTPPGTQHSFI